MMLQRLDAPKTRSSARLTAEIVALDARVDVIEADHVTDDYVLRLTPDVSPSAGEGLEVVQAPGGAAPVLRPFSNGASTDLDLRLFGLGTGVVQVNGTIPATAPDLAALDARVVVLETTSTIEARTDDPVGPAVGRIWLRTDL